MDIIAALIKNISRGNTLYTWRKIVKNNLFELESPIINTFQLYNCLAYQKVGSICKRFIQNFLGNTILSIIIIIITVTSLSLSPSSPVYLIDYLPSTIYHLSIRPSIYLEGEYMFYNNSVFSLICFSNSVIEQ